MKYFVKLVQDDGIVGYLNPDFVTSVFKEENSQGKEYWAIRLRGQPWEKPVTFYGTDIAPLIDAMRQEQISYTIPIDAILGPHPIPPF